MQQLECSGSAVDGAEPSATILDEAGFVYLEDAPLHLSKWFAVDESGQRLGTEPVLPLGQSALLTEVALSTSSVSASVCEGPGIPLLSRPGRDGAWRSP